MGSGPILGSLKLFRRPASGRRLWSNEMNIGLGVAGMVGQLRVQHPLDGRVANQKIDDGSGIRAMAFHANGQRLHAAECEVAVELTGAAAGFYFDVIAHRMISSFSS